jgi:hypothetical protein
VTRPLQDLPEVMRLVDFGLFDTLERLENMGELDNTRETERILLLRRDLPAHLGFIEETFGNVCLIKKVTKTRIMVSGTKMILDISERFERGHFAIITFKHKTRRLL